MLLCLETQQGKDFDAGVNSDKVIKERNDQKNLISKKRIIDLRRKRFGYTSAGLRRGEGREYQYSKSEDVDEHSSTYTTINITAKFLNT